MPMVRKKVSDKHPNFTPQGTRKRRTKSKDSRKKEIIKIRED